MDTLYTRHALKPLGCQAKQTGCQALRTASKGDAKKTAYKRSTLSTSSRKVSSALRVQHLHLEGMYRVERVYRGKLRSLEAKELKEGEGEKTAVR